MTKVELLNKIKESLNFDQRNMVFEMLHHAEAVAYDAGFKDALVNFAHMQNGVSYVGTSGRMLTDIMNRRKTLYCYCPQLVDWTKDE